MIAKSDVKEFLQSLTNKLMPLEGKIALMQVQKESVEFNQLKELQKLSREMIDLVCELREKLADNSPLSELTALTYISKAQVNEDAIEKELANIKMQAQEFNSQHNITGFLAYRNGYFIQRIEGRRYAIERLFSKICLDRRHRKVTLLALEPINQRFFDRWQMMQTLVADDGTELATMLDKMHDKGNRELSPQESVALVNQVTSSLS